MEVHGIDMTQGAYRVSFSKGDRRIRGLVPETLLAEWLRQSGRPDHGDAYQMIAVHRTEIQAALTVMATGEGRVRAPYDRLTLVEE